MSIFHNGKEYGATKVINYSASPDYNRGVSVTNIQDGNYQATDNGFLLIELQSQQSNVTKVAVIRSQNPITDNTGTEIASRVIQQFQYSEILTVQVMAREYYKLLIEGAGNPQVLSCMFYPYASTVPMKLTESVGVEQIEGLGELATVDNVNLVTQTTGNLPTDKGGTGYTTGARPLYVKDSQNVIRDDFTLDLQVGESWYGAFFLDKEITMIFANTGTYLCDYISFRRANNVLSNRRQSVIVITQANQTGIWLANFNTGVRYTRIK